MGAQKSEYVCNSTVSHCKPQLVVELRFMVASRTITELRRSNARAVTVSWCGPLERSVPPAEISVSRVILVFPVSDSAMETAVDAEPSASWMEAALEAYVESRDPL